MTLPTWIHSWKQLFGLLQTIALNLTIGLSVELYSTRTIKGRMCVIYDMKIMRAFSPDMKAEEGRDKDWAVFNPTSPSYLGSYETLTLFTTSSSLCRTLDKRFILTKGLEEYSPWYQRRYRCEWLSDSKISGPASKSGCSTNGLSTYFLQMAPTLKHRSLWGRVFIKTTTLTLTQASGPMDSG